MLQPNKLIGNKDFRDNIGYLFDRWYFDEWENEDISDYAKAMVNSIKRFNGEDVSITDIKPTKKPFGVKFKADGKRYWLKHTTRYISLQNIN